MLPKRRAFTPRQAPTRQSVSGNCFAVMTRTASVVIPACRSLSPLWIHAD